LVRKQANRLQGTLDPFILKATVNSWIGGAQRVEQITRGTVAVRPGSLSPARHRMEEGGWLTPFWGEKENRRRAKFFPAHESCRASAGK
jgi:PadR family transcriptional regulator, regulatory protein PadR